MAAAPSTPSAPSETSTSGATSTTSVPSPTIALLLAEAVPALTPALGDSARREATLLLAHCGAFPVSTVLAFPERGVAAPLAAAFRAVVARRAAGEPFAYITGTREFYSLSLAVTAAVLVPRPETETLVEAVLARLPAQAPAAVLDLGTGSGAIALALKHERPALAVTAVDRDTAALAVARANAERLGLDVRWLESNWFAAVAGERFDSVVANPPYVASGAAELAGALRYEPRQALDGGRDGLDAYRAILAGARDQLRPDGVLVLEHGSDQRAALTALAAQSGFRTAFVCEDLAGLPRVLGLEPLPS